MRRLLKGVYFYSKRSIDDVLSLIFGFNNDAYQPSKSEYLFFYSVLLLTVSLSFANYY